MRKFLPQFLMFLWTTLCTSFSAFANHHHKVDLVIHPKTIEFKSGKGCGGHIQGIAVNGEIPGPTLHFKKGDKVTLNVCNQLTEGTTIHWHGILVPWQMDGVEGVAQKAIEPGESFQYQFTLYQSGTYWYHAHSKTQEQDGLYGAFIVDPDESPSYHYTKDFVIVLSDWNNSRGQKTFLNLKKEGDYYSPKFPLQASLMKFMQDYRQADAKERELLLEDYKTMQKKRMNLYDISDVAYDAYLLNGKTKCCPWKEMVKPGDIVRLRFIGAAGSTIYKVKIPNGNMDNHKMTVVHVQGNDVQPEEITEFSIAPGETIDVLVKIQEQKPYIIYAESIDTLGVAIGGLMTDPEQCLDLAEIPPFPEPKPVTRQMMENMKSMGSMQGKQHHEEKQPPKMHKKNHSMEMQTEPSQVGDRFEEKNHHQKDQQIHPMMSHAMMTHGTKYQQLVAAVKTNEPQKPVDETIKMELFGYMDRFIWMINGLPEYKAKPIIIEPGKRYRVIFTNNSMMRHPMHLHGHWFILRNGHGEYDPLLHTIEVPPGATAVADVDADASGQWFFHCHHIYHMMAGMSRVFQYNTLKEIEDGELAPEHQVKRGRYINRPTVRIDEVRPLDHEIIHHPMAHSGGFYAANFLEIGAGPFHSIQEWTFQGLYGGDYNKLELFTKDAEIDSRVVEEADLDIFYWRLINQFWSVKGGMNYFYRPAQKPFWQPGIGIEGLMPYFIETNTRLYGHRGGLKCDVILSRDTQLTNNFFLTTEIRGIFGSKTIIQDELGSGFNKFRYTIKPFYRLSPMVSVFVEYEHTNTYGALKKIRRLINEPTKDESVTVGISLVF